MTSGDWTCALDDLLTERWQACTRCGGRPVVRGHVWTERPVALVLCGRCDRDPALEAALTTLLRQRYGG